MTKLQVCKNCNGNRAKVLFALPNVKEFAGKASEIPFNGGFMAYCPDCEIKFRVNGIKQELLIDLYDDGLSEWSVENSRNDWKRLTDFVVKNYNTGINILDIGCNRGELLTKIDDKHQKYGLEINKIAAAIANKNDKLNIWTDYDQIPKDMKFDLIYCTDVIEHIVSPTSFLIYLKNLLNKNGHLILTTGDAHNIFALFFKSKWWYSYFPEHISFISKKWLKKFCLDNNLTLSSCEKFYYNNSTALKKIKLFILSFSLFPFNSKNQNKILQFINKTKTPQRLQTGRGISPDHIFAIITNKAN